jgi:flagellar M-ring protein FliF
MEQLRTLLANMTPRGRMMLGGSVVGTIVLTFLLMQMAGKPSYDTVAAGLNPADTGKLTAALDAKGISYKISNNGTALQVQADQMSDAKIALAEKGLPGQTQPGYELFDKQKLGSSDFQQQVTYQRALEGELARTIGQVDGIQGAQVQLVLPQEELFANEESPAKAAVLLSGSADGVDPSAIRGVANLVSSSVKGLKPDNVTITDASGKMLWPNGNGDGDLTANAKQVAEARYNRELEATLGAMLAQSIGVGKSVVRVSSDLNVDRATKDQLVYGKKAVPISSESETEGLKGGAGGSAGASGAAANIPSYAAGGASGGNSNYDRKSKKTEWAVDKTVTRTIVAPGQVNRLNVALMVDASVPAAQLASLKSAVASAAGINPDRGDVLSVSAVKFAKQPAPPAAAAPSAMSKYIGYAKWGALALALAAFLFFMTRHLKRREREDLADPVWLRELTTPRPLAALEASANAIAIDEPEHEIKLRQVREAAQNQPDRIAQQVRAWMHDE